MHDKIEVKDILGLAEPATKLIEIISSAIGTLYEPRKISHLTINNFDKQFILSNRNILKKMGIELQDIIILEEAGLINSSSLTISGSNLYEYNNHLINFYDQKPKLQIYMLTTSGCQLKNIMSNQINLDYLKEIKQEYNIKKMSHSIILTRIIQGDKINYSLANTTEI